MSDNIETETIATDTPMARIVGGPERSKAVPLTWPVEYDGKVYDSIAVRRMTGQEVRDLMQGAVAGELDFLPMVDCPREVYEALDDDDLAKVDAVIEDFLPLRLRAAVGQTLENGADS